MINIMNRNSSRVWFCYSTLQRKEQQLSRHSKQKIRFHQEKNWTEKTDNAINKWRKTIKIHTLLNHSNQKIFKWTDQEKNLTRQIYKKNNQKNWKIFWNENHEKATIVSRINLYVICNKKKNDRMTSWWCTDKTFWNKQNNEINFQKLLFLTNEIENEKTHLTMWTISKKQIKMI